MPLRFTDTAAASLRQAIAEAGGVEVFAIGDVEEGSVTAIQVTCRGQGDRVTALLDRPRAGQVAIHNHPSGNLTASDADMALANLYAEDGVGVVIVDSAVTRSSWVVEPHVPKKVAVTADEIDRFFYESLPRVMGDREARAAQVEMARQVGVALSEDRPLVVEAGTGTGKTLAYLVPAALWALKNDGKVVVSTYTKALQAQIVSSDLPLLKKAGIPAESAVLEGRNNYVCLRRLDLAREEDADQPADERAELDAVIEWARSTPMGSRSEMAFSVDAALWERVYSDSDLTLKVKCPHFANCRFYGARRNAAAAHVIVVNHALLLLDLQLRAEIGRGFLPKYQRIILDEAHHLEDAATNVASRRLTSEAVQRAIRPLLSRPKRRGALQRLREHHPELPTLKGPVEALESKLSWFRELVRERLSTMADAVLDADGTPRAVTPVWAGHPSFSEEVVTPLQHLSEHLKDTAELIDKVLLPFDGAPKETAKAQPQLDLERARKRMMEQADLIASFLDAPVAGAAVTEAPTARWVELVHDRRGPTAAAAVAPIEVNALLRKILWRPYPGTVATSATLSVADSFIFWKSRVGLGESDEGRYPSPFDHARQALLGLPRDLPPPEDGGFLEATGQAVLAAVRASGGGAFVLCTSHAAVAHYARILRDNPGPRPILAQTDGSKSVLLDRFKEHRDAVLVGTDSFWEGVSVKGDGLRLVIIPRLPFRVPSDPLRAARHERLQARGLDPFRAYALPETAIKLRQGYGRLIRAATDRGVVLVLDRRIHDRQYGQILLRSLPPATRSVGPLRKVIDDMLVFFGRTGGLTLGGSSTTADLEPPRPSAPPVLPAKEGYHGPLFGKTTARTVNDDDPGRDPEDPGPF